MTDQNQQSELVELQDRVRRLEAADHRKDQFLRELAHEMGNVLLPIQLALEILKHPGADPTTLEQVKDILREQVPCITKVIDELRSISKVCRGNIELRVEDVDLASVVARAVESTRPLVEGRQHRLAVALPDQPIRLKADPGRFEQVLFHLLQNAARYTGPGGNIELNAAAEDGEVIVRVRDTGAGIDAELLPQVFELFVRGPAPDGQPTRSLGIGLTLVRSLVELHGGTVTAESDGPGRGSQFTIRLPVGAE